MLLQNKFKKIEFIIFSFFSLFCSVGFCEKPPSFSYKGLSASLQSDYFHTAKNFLPNQNSFENLDGNGSSYTHILIEPQVLYGLRPRWALGFSLGYSLAESFSQTRSLNKKNSGLSHAQFEGLYKAYYKVFLMQSRLRVTVPIFNIKPELSSRDLLLGEGATEVEVGSFVQTSFLRHKAYGYMGFTYRDGGRSGLIPWTLGMLNRKYFVNYGFEFNGYRSLTDDKSVNNDERERLVKRRNNGSRRFYSVNPSLTNVQGYVSVEIIKDLEVQLAYSQSIEGRNTAYGQTIFAQMTWRNFSLGSRKKERGVKEKDEFKYNGSDQELEDFFDSDSSS